MTKVKDIVNIHPTYFLSDFESGLINSTSKVFSYTQNFLCLFHLGQSIWRRINNLGLAGVCKSDDKFKLCIRYLLNLAFVPPQYVVKTYFAVYEYIKTTVSDILSPCLHYFE